MVSTSGNVIAGGNVEGTCVHHCQVVFKGHEEYLETDGVFMKLSECS